MKLRNIIASFLAVVAMAVGCTQELTGNLSTIKLDQSTVVFPEEGGSVTITVTAKADWSVDAATVPEGMTITPMSGNAGETKMTISTTASANDIDTDVVIVVGAQKQFITLYQPGDPALKPQFETFVAGEYWIMCQEGGEWFALKSTDCEIDNAKSYNYLYSVAAMVAEDGTLSSTASNVFTFEAVEGGFAIKDPSGGYLYQVADYNNFYLTSDVSKASVWTVEQISADEFMIENPSLSKWMQYSTSYDSAGAYGSLQEGATLPKLVKAEAPAAEPFVIETTEFELPIEAGEVVIPVEYNGVDIHVGEMPTWLTFYGYHDGEIKFTYESNEGGNREAVVVLTTCMDGNECTVELTFTQEGAIVETTADKINAAEDGTTLYKVTGVVKSIANSTYGNIYIADYTGEVFVYGTYDAAGNRFDAFTTPVTVGDIVTVCGVKTSHNGNPQMKNVTLEKHTPVSAKTVEQFLAAEVTADVYYMLTGTIKNIKLNDDGTPNVYGNFDIEDETGSVYVYGLLEGWGGPSKQFTKLGLENGDVVTIIGVRADFKGTAQVGSAFYLSHKKGSVQPGKYASNVTLGTVADKASYTDGVANVNGEENVATLKLGKTDNYGEGTVTLPAGTTKVTYYAVAWKNNPSKLEFSVGGTVFSSQAISANDGATGSSPYTLTVTDSDKYTVTLPSALTEETVVTVKTVETGKRAIIFGVVAE